MTLIMAMELVVLCLLIPSIALIALLILALFPITVLLVITQRKLYK